jgi:glutathione S-transferase
VGLTVWGRANSVNVQKALWCLAELDIAYERIDAGMAFGRNNEPDYLAMNPNGRVPTLVDGDFVLWESNAIMQYLADKVPGNTLFPRDPKLRADVVRWLSWDLAHFGDAFGALIFESLLKTKLNLGSPNETRINLAMSWLPRRAAVLEQHLTGRRYLVGNSVTLADYSVVRFESYRPHTPFDWRPYPNINAYFDHVRTLDSWVRTAPPTDVASLGRRPRAA